MPSDNNVVVICVPESLIPGLAELKGPVTLYMDKLRVEDGFAHADDEFVTSLRMLNDAVSSSGISPETLAIILERA